MLRIQTSLQNNDDYIKVYQASLKEITPVKVQQQAYVYFINEYVVF